MTSPNFREAHVDVGGAPVRYIECGQGPALVHLRGDGGPALTRAHELLGQRFHLLVFDTADASTIAQAIAKLGIDAFNLMASSGGARTAITLATDARDRVLALVLEAPALFKPGAEHDADLERRLRAVAAATLVLFGTRDDVSAPATGRIYRELIPNAHLVLVYDAAHRISADRPEAFTDVVLDFLERHEAFVINRAETVIHP